MFKGWNEKTFQAYSGVGGTNVVDVSGSGYIICAYISDGALRQAKINLVVDSVSQVAITSRDADSSNDDEASAAPLLMKRFESGFTASTGATSSDLFLMYCLD